VPFSARLCVIFNTEIHRDAAHREPQRKAEHATTLGAGGEVALYFTFAQWEE